MNTWFQKNWEFIATYAVMFIVSFVTLQLTTGAHAKLLEKHDVLISETCSDVSKVTTDVAVVKSEMSGLSEQMKELRLAMRELTSEIRRNR